MSAESQLKSELDMMGGELAKRARLSKVLESYYDSLSPLPLLIQQAGVTNAYRMLMSQSVAPWASLIVDAVDSRLEVNGIESGDKATNKALWDIWQSEAMDAESKLLIKSALIGGRSYALVWPDDDGGVDITCDGMDQMIVRYAEGSRRKRQSAFRFWYDEDARTPNCNLYTPDAIFKFVGPKDVQSPQNVDWKPRFDDDVWPLPNPFNVCPVIELGVNRKLKPGMFPYCHGEYQNLTSVLDRVNLLTFLGLICAFWMSFPVRAIIGDTIRRDDNQELLAPFRVGSDEIAMFENPDVRLTQFDSVDRGNLSITAELEQLAALSKTPSTMMVLSSSVSNISAEALASLEHGLSQKVAAHQTNLGESFEELLRVAGLMSDPQIILPPTADLVWAEHESVSLAAKADAAVKLSTILPQPAILEQILGFTSEQIERINAQSASDTMSKLITAAAQPPPVLPAPGQPMPDMPESPAPVVNG